MNLQEVMAEATERHGDAMLLSEPSTGRHISYREFNRLVQEVASDLIRRNLARGDRVALLLENSIECAALFMGCMRAGITFVPIHPLLSDRDIIYLARQSGARALFHSSQFAGRIQALPLDIPADRRILAGKAWLDAVAANPRSAGEARSLEGHEIAAIFYTSGTTARPKGVVHRLASLIGNGKAFAHDLGIRPEHRFYGNLAMGSIPGTLNLFLIPYLSGASIVIAQPFSGRQAIDFWSTPMAEGVNTFWFVPTILSILMELDRGETGAHYCRQNVLLALCGTAPLAPQLRHNFEKKYGIRIHESYGLSETFLLATNASSRPVLDGCAGQPLHGVEIRIDPKDGEVLVKTSYIMEGYLSETGTIDSPPLQDGFLATGDIGHTDAEGNIFLVGRKKDLIIRGGFNISPAAVEEVLLGSQHVAEASVVGQPHDVVGEEVIAVVRLKSGAEWILVQHELEALCREQLSPFQRPSRFLEIDVFPRNPAGKILKDRVRELVREKLHLPSAFQAPLAQNVEIWDAASRIRTQAIEYPDENLVRLISGRYIPIPATPARALDHGCGSGNNLIFLSRKGFTCTGMEISQTLLGYIAQDLEKAGLRADLRLIDGARLPYEDNYFDLIVSWNSIHYNATRENVSAVLSEFHRCLRPQGLLLLSTVSRDCSEFHRCRPIGNGSYRIEDPSSLDNRQGLRWFVSDDAKDLESLFHQFKEVRRGHTNAELFDHGRVNASDLVAAWK